MDVHSACRYSQLLGVDADLRSNWLDLLSQMPDYPNQTLTWVQSPDDIVVGSQLSGRTMLVEASAGLTPAAEAFALQGLNATGDGPLCDHPPCSTIVWPWCNVEYVSMRILFVCLWYQERSVCLCVYNCLCEVTCTHTRCLRRMLG